MGEIMGETRTTAVRPDPDIEADIHRLMITYPPLAHDRHRVDIAVQDGAVTVSGHVKALPTYHYLLNNLSTVPGVKLVNADGFYNDEALRREVGRIVPYGIVVVMEYGAVILAGKLPEEFSIEDLVKEVALIPGVHRVITSLR
jgi:osmotically-inducible protein OsmY